MPPKNKLLLAAGIFALLGTALALRSLAATSHVAGEAENGLIAGNAAAGDPVGASGNAAVRFGSSNSSAPYGLPAVAAMDRLPYLQPGTQAGGDSSYDRSGGANDATGQSGTYNGERLMLSQTGPGTVYRIWMTSIDTQNDWIKVYFDGETIPRINQKMGQFFSGNTQPFLHPFVADQTLSSGAWTSYLPLPYAKSIKITTSAAAAYFNVGYKKYPAGTQVATWTGNENSAAASAAWNNLGADPKPDSGNTVVSNTANLAASASQTILDTTGPRSISSIRLKIPGVVPNGSAQPATADILNNTRIRISWNNESTPSIDAPLGSFFGVGQHGAFTVRSLMAGMSSDGQMYMYLPMPFKQRAIVQLVNGRGTALNGISYEVRHKAFNVDFSNVGYLHTQFTDSPHTGATGDIPMLKTTGMGHFVGVTASYRLVGGGSDNTYQRGDERIYVDGNPTPAIYGTGTEDFFDGGHHFSYGPFSRPIASLAVSGQSGNDHITAANRFFLADSIPFTNQINAGIERGDQNASPVDAWMLAYYYKK